MINATAVASDEVTGLAEVAEVAELLPERQVEVLADALAELDHVNMMERYDNAQDIIEVLRTHGYVIAQLAE